MGEQGSQWKVKWEVMCTLLPVVESCLIIGISCRKSALKTEFHFCFFHVTHRWKYVLKPLHWYFFTGQLGSHGPKNLEILLWIYPSVQLLQIYCHMLAFSAAPPVPHVVSSLRCAEWLHESVNVINGIHYWQDCSVVGFTTKTLPVNQGFYLFIPAVSMISQFLWPARFSLVIGY